jgi:hypothetical protein
MSAVMDAVGSQRAALLGFSQGWADEHSVRRHLSAAHLSADLVWTRRALKLPDKPSIAVLPFTNLAGDKEQEYFADGVVEDISTIVSFPLAVCDRAQSELHCAAQLHG